MHGTSVSDRDVSKRETLKRYNGSSLALVSPWALLFPLALLLFVLLPISSQASGLHVPPNSLLLAQSDEQSDAYDPFADYSEFEEASEEEADINFFRNGRFLTIGAIGGYRVFTDVLGQMYTPAAIYGGQVSYFFDLRFALQISYITGSHGWRINASPAAYSGTVEISLLSFDLKYYLNVQNVTRGLSSINPYIIAGAGQAYRSVRYDGIPGFVRDTAWSFNGGAGIEFPILRNRMYIGLEGVFHYVTFADEASRFPVLDGSGNVSATNLMPRGDFFRVSGLLGVNF
jgi:hypothetical protein